MTWVPPSWLGWGADRVGRLRSVDARAQWRVAGDATGTVHQETAEWAPLTQPFIRRRLDALADELERLDRSPDTFAKAFHTMVARSALDALLADARELAHRPSRCASDTFDVEIVGPPMALHEELEL